MKNIKLSLSLCFIAMIPVNAQAEYRAYQYLLSGNTKEQKSLNVITTTLSPVAISKYHNIAKDKVYLLRTWMCDGNTAHQKICAPPYQQENLQVYLQSMEGSTP